MKKCAPKTYIKVTLYMPNPGELLVRIQIQSASSVMSEGKRTRSRAALLSSEEADVTSDLPVQKKGTPADVSAYELERQENIRRNEQFLASLGLNSVKSALSASVPVKVAPKKKAVAVKKVQNDAPLRRSGRVTIDKLQEEVANLSKNGDSEALAAKQKELDEMLNKKQEGSYQVALDSAYERQDWKRLSADPVPLSELSYDTEKYNEAQAKADLSDLLQSLRGVQDTSTKKKKAAADRKLAEYTEALRGLSICNSEVAKLTENRITSVCFHPASDKLVVLAGDKSGNLGLWDVQKTESSDISGVYKYQPHVSNIARIHAPVWRPTAVYSTSYDGTIRHFDVTKEHFSLCFQAPEDLDGFYFTEADFLHDQADCMYVSTSDGCAALIDFRASASSYAWKRECSSGYKLNSIQQHPTSPHLIVTSERTAISLYDVRKGSSSSSAALKPLTTLLGHTHSINAAHISPDGEFLVSVSQDHTIRTWRNFLQPPVEADCVVTRHDNNTGRWLSTLRPTFDPKHANAFLLGCLLQPRRIEVFAPVITSTMGSPSAVGKATGRQKIKAEGGDAYTLNLLCYLQDDELGSVCSRNAFHPSLDVIAGGNSSGRVHIFRKE
jgi:WD40 repeat protein